MYDMFQEKIDELLSSMLIEFGLAHDIWIAGFDELGRDNDTTLEKVLRTCRQVTKSGASSDTQAFLFLVKQVSSWVVAQTQGKCKH